MSGIRARINLMKPLVRRLDAKALQGIYHALVLTPLLYASEVWYHRINVADRDKLRSIHYTGCRLITGASKTSPMEAVVAEAGMRSLDFYVSERCAQVTELLTRIPHSRFGPGWVAASTAALPKSLTTALGEVRTSTDPLLWRLPYNPADTHLADNVVIISTPPAGLLRTADPAALAKANAERLARATTDCRWVVLTDGSVMRDGRAAGAFSVRNDGMVVHTGTVALPTGSSPYSAEEATALHALRWLEEHTEYGDTTLLTDAQSWCTAMDNGPIRQRGVSTAASWAILLRLARSRKVTLSHIFAHCDLQAHDDVDERAKETARAAEDPLSALHRRDSTRLAVQRLVAADDARLHGLPRRGRFAVAVLPTYLPRIQRSDQILLAQLRVGVIPSIGGHFHDTPDACPLCGQLALARGGETLAHLLVCPAATDQRTELHITGPELLWSPDFASFLTYAKHFVTAKLQSSPPPPPPSPAHPQPLLDADTDDVPLLALFGLAEPSACPIPAPNNIA
jgi:ribonuclease HI